MLDAIRFVIKWSLIGLAIYTTGPLILFVIAWWHDMHDGNGPGGWGE